MGGKSTRVGTCKCHACRKPFTVKIGTIFESSHVKMHLLLQAIFLIAVSKKGISSNQLHRTLGIDDQCRAENLLMGVVGKRLTYETVS